MWLNLINGALLLHWALLFWWTLSFYFWLRVAGLQLTYLILNQVNFLAQHITYLFQSHKLHRLAHFILWLIVICTCRSLLGLLGLKWLLLLLVLLLLNLGCERVGLNVLDGQHEVYTAKLSCCRCSLVNGVRLNWVLLVYLVLMVLLLHLLEVFHLILKGKKG